MSLARLRRIDPGWLVIAVFAIAALVIPTLTPVATTDDWGYSRSVEIFRESHRLAVFPVVAATAVFQIIWGIAFSYPFGMSLGVMRVSTLAMAALGAIAFGWLLRQIGISRGRAALGMALYLFNPLQFILAFTFMTDAHFTALMIISLAFYVRGMSNQDGPRWAILTGSLFATCAFLTRQQGILIPAGVVFYLLASRQIKLNRSSLLRLIETIAIPAIGVLAYVSWLRLSNDVPDVQTGFLDEVQAAGFFGGWELFRRLTFVQVMYAGAFVLPLTLAAIPLVPRIRLRLPRWTWLVLIATLALFSYGFWQSWIAGRHMPYIPQFVGSGGLGPADVRGSRPRILEQPWFDVTTIVCGISVIVAIVLIARAIGNRKRFFSPAIGLILCVGLGQIAGVLPPSFHYLHRGYSLDRYLLPLLPFAILFVLWSVRDLPIFTPIAWVAIAIVAIVNTALVRDYLTFLDTVWRAANSAQVAGARPDQIEAGAAWDGYHLYTLGVDEGIERARTRGGPWWTYFYGKPTDSTYLVSSKPVSGYVIIGTYEYDTWLPNRDRSLYLLRKADAPALPELVSDQGT